MSLPAAPDRPGWPSMVLRKCKEQPAVPLGAGATVAALLGATYHLRRGNRNRFNQFLRWRIYAQGLTVAALMVYGINEMKEREAAGMIERTPNNKIMVYPQTPQPRIVDQVEPIVIKSSTPSSLPASLSTVVDSDAEDKTASAYPLRKEERMSVSDFAKRLRAAEALHKEEQDAKKA
ncbi:hypothetical protein B9479_001717 [Cryptococcus floricola]|uniref:HIG1 domain-containing protein n=1 Tax=Cryptococcus floricola TaxID=2591691 RepID=A0A5D3B1U0_9TREE|nr:hypothetical protein B9479_001717 [Cryptococcus floricola]